MSDISTIKEIRKYTTLNVTVKYAVGVIFPVDALIISEIRLVKRVPQASIRSPEEVDYV